MDYCLTLMFSCPYHPTELFVIFLDVISSEVGTFSDVLLSALLFLKLSQKPFRAPHPTEISPWEISPIVY